MQVTTYTRTTSKSKSYLQHHKINRIVNLNLSYLCFSILICSQHKVLNKMLLKPEKTFTDRQLNIFWQVIMISTHLMSTYFVNGHYCPLQHNNITLDDNPYKPWFKKMWTILVSLWVIKLVCIWQYHFGTSSCTCYLYIQVQQISPKPRKKFVKLLY